MNNNRQQKYIYYWSKYCPFCKKFSEHLLKSSVSEKFYKVCVDTPGIKLPSYVRRVPTIQIFDDNSNRQVLEDKHAFEWLNLYSENPCEIQDFCAGEMSSTLSDCFSYLDKNKEATHTFEYLDNIGKHFITTPPEGAVVNEDRKSVV